MGPKNFSLRMTGRRPCFPALIGLGNIFTCLCGGPVVQSLRIGKQKSVPPVLGSPKQGPVHWKTVPTATVDGDRGSDKQQLFHLTSK